MYSYTQTKLHASPIELEIGLEVNMLPKRDQSHSNFQLFLDSKWT